MPTGPTFRHFNLKTIAYLFFQRCIAHFLLLLLLFCILSSTRTLLLCLLLCVMFLLALLLLLAEFLLRDIRWWCFVSLFFFSLIWCDIHSIVLLNHMLWLFVLLWVDLLMWNSSFTMWGLVLILRPAKTWLVTQRRMTSLVHYLTIFCH